METERMIKELRILEEKHAKDRVLTGQLNISLMCNCVANQLEILKAYEDAYKKGLLVKLPVALGDTVYVLAECKNFDKVLDGTLYDSGGGYGTATGYYCPYELTDSCPHEGLECDETEDKTAVFEDTISYIGIDETGVVTYTNYTKVSGNIGENIFLTREEAEKALLEREGEYGEINGV